MDFSLWGGDPLISESFWSHPSFKSTNVFRAINSNPILILKSMPTDLKMVSLVVMPFFSIVEQEHNLISGIDSFSQIIEARDYLRDLNIPLVLTLPMNSQHSSQLPDIYDWTVSHGIFLELYPRPHLRKEEKLNSQTLLSLKYYAQKANIWIHPLKLLQLKWESDWNQLYSCVAGEAWPMMNQAKGVKLINQYLIWHFFIQKALKWHRQKQK